MSDPPAGLGRLFTNTAARLAEGPAIVSGDSRRSFADVESQANRLGRAMSSRGVQQQNRVAIVLGNCPEFVELIVACWKIGATPLPLNHKLPEREFAALVELGQPALVLGRHGQPLADLCAEARKQDDAPLPDVPSVPWKAIATGGATGRPKLIVDHAGLPSQAILAAKVFMMEEGMRHLIAGPLYHNGPFVWGMIHLLIGGTLLLMERFDADAYIDLLECERVGWSFVVPTMLHRIIRLPPEELQGRDFAALRVLLHAAAPCPDWLKRRTIEIFGAERVWELYGATEVGSTMIRGDEWLEHPGSVGKPPPGVGIRILDEEGGDLSPREVGEIWIKPATDPTFRYVGAQPRVREGFVSVGDMGWLDEQGYLYIADRRADLIISGGSNVYPAEVEGVLLEHPGVADAVVIGLSDAEWGQRVHAIIQANPVVATAANELEHHCRERLASYKVPRSWEFVKELPRDPSGKIRRGALRDERQGASA